MNIDSYSISNKIISNSVNIILFFVKKCCFYGKNINIAIDLSCVFCYNVFINNNLYILCFYQFFIKKDIDFFEYMIIINNINSSLTQSKY